MADEADRQELNTLMKRFQFLDSDRSQKLNRARTHAALVIPGLLPERGRAQNQELPVPYSSMPAEGTLSLAARIVSVLLPLNNQPFFELSLNDAVAPEGEDVTTEEAVLGRFERHVHNRLLGTNIRPTLFTIEQHLIVCGDVLVFQKNDLDFQVFRLDQYVVRRKPDGEWVEIIIEEWVCPDDLPEKLRNMPTTKEQAAVGPESKFEAIYTQIKKDPDQNKWDVRKEFRGQKIEDDRSYEVPPYFPLRWEAVAGEDYGRSLIESTFGAVRVLDSLEKALVDGNLMNSEFRWGVNPAGLTNIRDWEQSANGEAIPAVNGDIFPIQASSQAQIAITNDAIATREARLGRRFLLGQSIQRNAERVTATEIRFLAQQLEEALGGPLSLQTREIQIPFVRRTMYRMALNNELPTDMAEFVKDKNSILQLNVKAGLEVLNREVENEKLTIMAEQWRNLPPEASAIVNWPIWVEKWMTSFGIETTGLVKTPEQLNAERQAAIQEQQAQAFREAAVETASRAAVQPEAVSPTPEERR